MNGFPTRRPAALAEVAPEQRWLIEGLWSEQAVGIIGGEPKCGKSFLALDLAVAVAAGVPCLRRFATPNNGPVLLFAAEDAAHIVRQRLVWIAQAANVDFDSLDINIIDVPTVRLDQPADQYRLRATVARIKPRLLVLDPLVRLHRIDENAAAEVAPMLAFLRSLQRQFATAVVLVHHARKGAAHTRGGQALRGSSELHAWGDSNLYLRRRSERFHLSIEHRAARSPDDLILELQSDPQPLALQIVSNETAPDPSTPSPRDRIEHLLAAAAEPLSQRELRAQAHLRAKTVGAILNTLVNEGRVTRTPKGYLITP
jgi:hypothetical protein